MTSYEHFMPKILPKNVYFFSSEWKTPFLRRNVWIIQGDPDFLNPPIEDQKKNLGYFLVHPKWRMQCVKNLMCIYYYSTSSAHAVSLKETGNCLSSFLFFFYMLKSNILIFHSTLDFDFILHSLLNGPPHYTFLVARCMFFYVCVCLSLHASRDI